MQAVTGTGAPDGPCEPQAGPGGEAAGLRSLLTTLLDDLQEVCVSVCVWERGGDAHN